MTCTDSCGSNQIEYKGTGSETLFTFPFEYIKQADVYVHIFNEETDTWVEANDPAWLGEYEWTFANATTIEFTTAPQPPVRLETEANIRISRCTDIDPMIAQFNPGSAIRARDLNDNFEQLQLAIQEGRCANENNLGKDGEVITRYQQENGQWVEFTDNKLASSDAIVARHDVYVQEDKPVEPPVEQTGKGWQNTDDCWSSYWNPDATAWVAYVNTGPRGEQGPAGQPGEGIVGPPPGLQDPAAIATNVPAKDDGTIGDATADVVQDPDSLDLQFQFGIPEGLAATVDAGTTTTGPAGSDAEVTNSGTLNDAIFDFIIPRGDKGEKGDKADPVVTVSDIAPRDPDQGDIWFDSKNAEAFFYYCDGDSCQWVSLIKPGPQGPAGEPGKDGADGEGVAATVNVGSTTTGAPGSNALVSNSGTEQAAVFNFTIPRGDKGEDGDEGTAATIAVGTTTTGDAGTDASVTNSGDSTAAVFNFTIPRGEKGESFTSVVSDDAPENPENGDAWFNSNVGRLFIYYTDGSSAQWVQA